MKYLVTAFLLTVATITTLCLWLHTTNEWTQIIPEATIQHKKAIVAVLKSQGKALTPENAAKVKLSFNFKKEETKIASAKKH